MGERFQVIVDLEAGEAEAVRLREKAVAWLVGQGIVVADGGAYTAGPAWRRAVDDDGDHEPWGGLVTHVGRGAFHSGADAPEHAVCPQCAARRHLDADGWAWASTAIGTWSDTGTATLTCPSCTRTALLPDWEWDNAPFAFGHLGLKFWDWPELSEDFRARIAGVLEGHRTAYLWGKI